MYTIAKRNIDYNYKIYSDAQHINHIFITIAYTIY